MNEEFIDNIIINLNIIGIIKVNEKLCIRKGHLQIDISSNFQSIRRWFFRDSRDIIIIYLNKLMTDITSLFKKINDYPREEGLWVISRILVELDNTEGGFNNLKKTYSTDPYMVFTFENMSLKFRQIAQLYRTSII